METNSSNLIAPPAASIACRTSSVAEGTDKLSDVTEVQHDPGQDAENERCNCGDAECNLQ